MPELKSQNIQTKTNIIFDERNNREAEKDEKRSSLLKEQIYTIFEAGCLIYEKQRKRESFQFNGRSNMKSQHDMMRAVKVEIINMP